MIISRSINKIDFDIDVYKANELYFDECIAKKLTTYSCDEITKLFYNEKQQYKILDLQWELTNICNFNCPFCYINIEAEPKVALPFSAIKPAIDNLIDQGLLFCSLTGGEPLLHPNFIDIYKYLKKNGVLVTIYTNLSILTDDILELFSEYQPLKVNVSIYGISDEQMKNVTKQRNVHYNQVLQNVLKLKNAQVCIECRTIVNKLTIGDIDKIEKWCSENNISYDCSYELNEKYNGDNVLDYSFDKKQNMHLMLKSSNHSVDESLNNREKKVKKMFNCGAGKYSAFLSYNMEIRPCIEFYGVKNYNFKCINRSEKDAIKSLSTKIESVKGDLIANCRGCDLFSNCGLCAVSVYKNTIENNRNYCQLLLSSST